MLLKVDPSHCCLLFGLPNLFLLPLLPNSEKAMAPRSSTLAWKIPWMEEPGRLQSMGRVCALQSENDLKYDLKVAFK